ncbi:GNAT family N-acetyltransferase [Paenibacillus sp. R14(2021)]|uniref:GNAT family N-acetyltransferase n=1 Tax=Paenibacillus sp. R14(2021) TaxID=2859228 RepID=UPI001C613C65|nr:GNAT family N-acetyltransferase [Paenibacillus sp. R14(2021)]
MRTAALFTHPPIFETERLLLRRLELTDAPDYYAVASDPLVSETAIWQRHESIEDTLGFLQVTQDKFEAAQAFHWGIIERASGRLIGRTGLFSLDAAHEKAEIGYALSSQYWNQGIVTEASRLIIHYGLREAGLNRIEARCNANNAGSCRVLEKLGMTYEGILRKQLKIKGVFVDQRMYGILGSDLL